MFTNSYENIMKNFSKTVQQLKDYANQEERVVQSYSNSIITLTVDRDKAIANAEKAWSSAKKINDLFDLGV